MMVATDRVAVSEGAQASLFGRSPTASSVIYCGVDIEQYQFDSANRERIRQELATLDDVPVILHVGGFRPVKNHVFLIEIFRAFKAGYEPRAKLWLVGDGPLRKEIEVHVAASGLVGAVRFLGTRSDVPAVLSAADVFLFPSHFEGLGLAVVEAQAAGLSVVISDVIPAEATVVDGLVTRKGFSDSAESWAEAVDQAYRAHCGRNVDPGQLQRFDIRSNARRIRRVYGLTD